MMKPVASGIAFAYSENTGMIRNSPNRRRLITQARVSALRN
ncbi:hypothetical protein RLIN73S_04455 [Rhodanobacter lindaniclasticus]